MKRLSVKRPKNKISVADVDKLEVLIPQIQKLQQTIQNCHDKLQSIHDEHNWLNYLSSDSYSELTEDEQYRLAGIAEKIRYCNQ